MLVISRRPGESFQIRNDQGDMIRVTVLCVQGHVVRVGIAAAQKWNIVREEVLTRQDAKQDAAMTADGA